MYDTASELYIELQETYFDECNKLFDAKRKNIELKYDPVNLFLKDIIMNTGLKMNNWLIQQEK